MHPSKAKVLQVIGVIIILLGTYVTLSRLQSAGTSTDILAGIGPVVIGIAVIIISMKKESKKD